MTEKYISLIIPAMNEEETIGTCITKAIDIFETLKLSWEVIVADNSTDRTSHIARSLGAKVITPEKLGYGNAYIEGFAEAKGEYIIMADADDTYDLHELPCLISVLNDKEVDYVIGTRSNIEKGAMPLLHRYIGNPVLTRTLNILFNTTYSDTHSGMRIIKRSALGQLNLKSGGMEFASEMMIEAARAGLNSKEIPISYYPRIMPSKLHSFQDGWRHLRYMMLYKPMPFLFIPGTLVFIIGLLLNIVILFRGHVETLRMHSVILSSLLLIIGTQTIAAGIYMKAYGATHGLYENKGFIKKLLDRHSLEKEGILGIIFVVIGIVLGLKVLLAWVYAGYGTLSEVESAVAAMIFSIIGIQIIFTALFISVMLSERGINNK